MKYAVLFAGIVFGCSADPGGVTKPPPSAQQPGVAAPGSGTVPVDCPTELFRLGSCMTQTDFDATALQALLQNTTQGTCYACHVGLLDKLDFDWFRRHPDFISQCTQDGLVYYNGIEVFGMG